MAWEKNPKVVMEYYEKENRLLDINCEELVTAVIENTVKTYGDNPPYKPNIMFLVNVKNEKLKKMIIDKIPSIYNLFIGVPSLEIENYFMQKHWEYIKKKHNGIPHCFIIYYYENQLKLFLDDDYKINLDYFVICEDSWDEKIIALLKIKFGKKLKFRPHNNESYKIYTEFFVRKFTNLKIGFIIHLIRKKELFVPQELLYEIKKNT